VQRGLSEIYSVVIIYSEYATERVRLRQAIFSGAGIDGLSF
jgi:hypothetical protein